MGEKIEESENAIYAQHYIIHMEKINGFQKRSYLVIYQISGVEIL